MPSIEELTGRPVEDYSPLYSPVEMTSIVYRVGTSRYETRGPGHGLEALFEAFGEEPEIEEVTALVIGSWNGQEPSADRVNPALCLWRLRERMPRLSCLYIGDVDSDEEELSWIEQTQWGPALNAFPDLDEVTIKGGAGLRLSKLDLPYLESLTLIATELSNEVLEDVMRAKLPALSHLELWLGDTQNQAASDPVYALDTLRPCFARTQQGRLLFPRLRSLGLRNCGWINELLVETAGEPLWGALESLDLSMGTLTEEGLEALLGNDLSGLKRLDVSATYIEDLELLEQLESRGVRCTAQDMRRADPDGYRYVDVWE